jgi:hypothetical protein
MVRLYLLSYAFIQGRTGLLGGDQSGLCASLLEFTSRAVPKRFLVGLFCSLGDLGVSLHFSR